MPIIPTLVGKACSKATPGMTWEKLTAPLVVPFREEEKNVGFSGQGIEYHSAVLKRSKNYDTGSKA